MRFLDPPKQTPRWSAWETGGLALYVAIVGFGIRQHVPWADESQAWMLAQEVSLRTLLVHSLHYEGTPGLWHVLLQLLQTLRLSFTAARRVTGGIAAAGVAVLLAYAPFPRIVRLLLPFSFFLAYQDAVIARSYVLFAVFAFTAATMLRSPRPRPLRLALVLGLMANISLHALIASGGLAIVAAAARKRPRMEPRPRRLSAAVLLLLFWLSAVASMAPARDVDFSAGNNIWRGLTKVENRLGVRTTVPPVISSLDMAGLPRSPLPVHVREGRRKAWNKIARTLAVITYPLSSYRWLALLLVTLVSVQACRRRGRRDAPNTIGGAPLGPLGLAPYLIMVAAFTSLYLEPRHAGMVFTGFVISAWLTWPVSPSSDAPSPRKYLLLTRATSLVFACVLAVQITWTLHALLSEHALGYSPDKATAVYLKEHGVGSGPSKRAAGFYYYSVGPLLYFDQNIYANQPQHRYWSWGIDMRTYATVQNVLASHPDFIVVGGYQHGPEAEVTHDWLPNTPPEPGVRLGDFFFIANYFRNHGYHETLLFCGHSWMRSSYAEQVCQSILEPNAPGQN